MFGHCRIRGMQPNVFCLPNSEKISDNFILASLNLYRGDGPPIPLDGKRRHGDAPIFVFMIATDITSMNARLLRRSRGNSD